MKYYYYISTSKVDMLVSQIRSHRPSKLTAEFGLNIGVLKSSLKSERDIAPNNTRVARLESVVDYLRHSENLGTVDEPNSWIADTQSTRISLLTEGPNVVFFTGTSARGIRFGLGGSADHLLSRRESNEVRVGWSFLPDLLMSLQIMTKLSEDSKHAGDTREQATTSIAIRDRSQWMDLLRAVDDAAGGPSVTIEFIAKNLLTQHETQQGPGGVLMSPLYIAAADRVAA